MRSRKGVGLIFEGKLMFIKDYMSTNKYISGGLKAFIAFMSRVIP